MNVLIIVPAFNEAKVIASTLTDIKSKTKHLKSKQILVVDDGSIDNTFEIAKKKRVPVVRHAINRGLGGAIGTGLTYAQRNGFDLAVTIDADGQHDPKDITKVILPILKGRADLVIGSRFKGKNKIPADRRLLLKLSNIYTRLLFNQTTSDSQSGFRAFGKKAIENIHIKTQRMEVSSELFSEVRRLNLKLSEVPIKVKYTKYSISKGQTNSDAISVGFKLLIRLFR